MKRVLSIFLVVVMFAYAGIYFVTKFKVTNTDESISAVQGETTEVKAEVTEYQNSITLLTQNQQEFIAQLQEYLGTSAQYRQELTTLQGLLDNLENPTTEEYEELQSQIETLTSQITALEEEFDTYVEENNITSVYSALVNQYSTLTASAIRVNEIYNRLLTLLNVDDEALKSATLASIESDISDINTILDSIGAMIEDINNNNEIINTIKSKVNSEGSDTHLIILTYDYTDEFANNYISSVIPRLNTNGTYDNNSLFVGMGLYTSSTFSYNYSTSQGYYYNYGCIRSSVAKIKSAGDKITVCMSITDNDLASGYNYLAINTSRYVGYSDSTTIFRGTISESDIYTSSQFSTGMGSNNYSYQIEYYGNSKEKLVLSYDLPDIINIDLTNSTFTEEVEGVMKNGILFDYNITSYNFN